MSLDPIPILLRGDARSLPLPDESVDLVVTSPPYFGLRSYQDAGEHYAGQIGSEDAPLEFIAALIECTREMVRVLKPSGSIFINLGDKYQSTAPNTMNAVHRKYGKHDQGTQFRPDLGVRSKSLALLPERYRIAAVDELGLIARAVLVWSKPNGLPESVTDRVRRSHEDWVHLTKRPRYYSAVDEIRQPHAAKSLTHRGGGQPWGNERNPDNNWSEAHVRRPDPLGTLPGSVWEIASQPLHVPAELGVDHFAAFPMEWPRRLILGWSPREVCTACGEGRRPQSLREMGPDYQGRIGTRHGGDAARLAHSTERKMLDGLTLRTITGYVCACPDTSAPSTPGVVLDPFGGTGTTALVAAMNGRHGISVDLSSDYGRLARWRCSDAKERARAAGLDPDAVARVERVDERQGSLMDLLDGEAS